MEKKFFLISRFDLFISRLNGDEFILMIWTLGCGGVISVKGKICQELVLFFDNNTVTAVYLNQINSDYYIGLRLKYLLVHSKPLFFYHCEKCVGGGVPVGTEVGIRTPLALSWSCLRKLWSAYRSHGTRRETNISFPDNRVSNLQYYRNQNSTRLNFKSVDPIKSSLNLKLIITYFLQVLHIEIKILINHINLNLIPCTLKTSYPG